LFPLNLPLTDIFLRDGNPKREHAMPKEILIVDDEPSIVVPIQFLMEQQGYNVIVAQNGEEALDVIFKYKPDLILLDIMLPGIDGYEVCEIVRLNPEFRHVKIIFLTAKGRQVEIAKGMALGADEYITKPFSNAEVVAKVKALLEDTHEETGT
jgi:DNA-binding response OmpR family regulator